MYGLGLVTRSMRYTSMRVDVGVHLEALRRHHLERLARLDVADELVDDGGVLLDACAARGAPVPAC